MPKVHKLTLQQVDEMILENLKKANKNKVVISEAAKAILIKKYGDDYEQIIQESIQESNSDNQ